MGYRSNVAYTIRFRDAGKFFMFVGGAQNNETTQEAIAECEINKEKWQINFLANHVKWYAPRRDPHEALLAAADVWIEDDMRTKEYTNMGYIFLRVGEDTRDIEEECNGDYNWDWMYVNREIITDWE